MKKNQFGKTLIETLSMLCLIGILSVSALQLYTKAMNITRANYIMREVFFRATELMGDKVAQEHNHKVVDLSTQLDYGYSFCASGEECKPKRQDHDIVIKLKGYFPVGLCRILKKKIKTQEYAGLKNIKADEVDLAPIYHKECPTDDDITSMTFIIDDEFKEQTF